ncbi:hypothetical protein [Laspinema olomoucense]|uniref:hypothetical protein n=1 Tax=Laspinema olomoucense TaxID=3231600 RepID=UPI0021BB2091|nr:hypothetical protein [Laspinema sp. D3c]MCT7994210.1 hypothetical protein [Laspinema sp. D3c]
MLSWSSDRLSYGIMGEVNWVKFRFTAIMLWAIAPLIRKGSKPTGLHARAVGGLSGSGFFCL